MTRVPLPGRSRAIVPALVLALLLAAWAAPPAAAGAIELHQQVTVRDGEIRLGDLFGGLDAAQAAIVVAYAPPAGRQAAYDAAWLAAAARHHRVAWAPGSRLDRSVVTRASRVVQRAEIEAALREALAERNGRGRYTFELDGGIELLHLPADAEGAVRVLSLHQEPRTQRFTATLGAGAAASPDAAPVIGGRLHHTLEVPVPARRIAAGEVIRSGDLDWVDIPAQSLDPRALTDAGAVVGQAAARPLRPGTPLRDRDIRAPLLVTKGTLVTLLLRTPAMVLTSQGRALDDGSDGQTIRVVNTQSNRTVEGVVGAGGIVTVPLLATAYR